MVKYQNKMLKAFYQRPDHALILIEIFIKIFCQKAITISRRVLESSRYIWHIGIGLICNANLGIFVEYFKGIDLEKD